MIEYTKEEISLCKQVAKKHRKPLKNFDLVIGTYLSGEEFIGYFHEELIKEKSMNKKFDEIMVSLCGAAKTTKPMIPLWTISDCLEFFRKRLWKIEYWHDPFELDWMEIGIICCVPDPDFVGKAIYRKGKTPLEACLKAVLAVLKEAK